MLIVDLFGNVILQTSGTVNISIKPLVTGTYFVIIKDGINSFSNKISITRLITILKPKKDLNLAKS